MNIYVGNLPYQLTDEELKAAFEVHGSVVSARIIIDRDSGRSKGFGFVEMTDSEQATAAIAALNETEMGERSITVNEARPKAPRSDNRGDGGGRY